MIKIDLDKNQEKNIHHLFEYYEVKKKIVEIFGEPKTDEDHLFIQAETQWAWKKLPCYKLPIKKHRLVHIEQGTNKRRIRSHHQVLAGLKGAIKAHKQGKK